MPIHQILPSSPPQGIPLHYVFLTQCGGVCFLTAGRHYMQMFIGVFCQCVHQVPCDMSVWFSHALMSKVERVFFWLWSPLWFSLMNSLFLSHISHIFHCSLSSLKKRPLYILSALNLLCVIYVAVFSIIHFYVAMIFLPI